MVNFGPFLDFFRYFFFVFSGAKGFNALYEPDGTEF